MVTLTADPADLTESTNIVIPDPIAIVMAKIRQIETNYIDNPDFKTIKKQTNQLFSSIVEICEGFEAGARMTPSQYSKLPVRTADLYNWFAFFSSRKRFSELLRSAQIAGAFLREYHIDSTLSPTTPYVFMDLPITAMRSSSKDGDIICLSLETIGLDKLGIDKVIKHCLSGDPLVKIDPDDLTNRVKAIMLSINTLRSGFGNSAGEHVNLGDLVTDVLDMPYFLDRPVPVKGAAWATLLPRQISAYLLETDFVYLDNALDTEHIDVNALRGFMYFALLKAHYRQDDPLYKEEIKKYPYYHEALLAGQNLTMKASKTTPPNEIEEVIVPLGYVG